MEGGRERERGGGVGGGEREKEREQMFMICEPCRAGYSGVESGLNTIAIENSRRSLKFGEDVSWNVWS